MSEIALVCSRHAREVMAHEGVSLPVDTRIREYANDDMFEMCIRDSPQVVHQHQRHGKDMKGRCAQVKAGRGSGADWFR